MLATIPVGVSGLLLKHLFRTVLGKPMPAAALLVANGLVLLVGERLRRRAPVVAPAGVPADAGAAVTVPGAASGTAVGSGTAAGSPIQEGQGRVRTWTTGWRGRRRTWPRMPGCRR